MIRPFLVAVVLLALTTLWRTPSTSAIDAGTLFLAPSEQTTTTGQTITVRIRQRAAVVTIAAQASLTFDRARLQATDIAMGTAYTGAIFIPGRLGQTEAQAIAEANGTTGKLAFMATYFPPGTGSVPAGETDFLTITFSATANGLSPLTLSNAEMLISSGDSMTVTVAHGRAGIGPDVDGDGTANAVDNCPYNASGSQADADNDQLGDACEAHYVTNSAVADTDADGCKDGHEVRYVRELGGARNPGDVWDFFDVTGDKNVDLSDALDVMNYFGDPGTSTPGNLRDRNAPDTLRPWRSAEANDGVDLTDVLTTLEQFGDGCAA